MTAPSTGITAHIAARENKMPTQALENITTVSSPVDACTNPDGYITLINSGQTVAYNIQVTETLTSGLDYAPGSTRWRLNSGAWNGPNPAYDPSPTTSPLQWSSAQISALSSLNPTDTLEIEFDLNTDCSFTGGDVAVVTQYEDPPGQIHANTPYTSTVGFREPDITVTKTRSNDPIGCGELIEWTISVVNNSGYTLPILWVEDTMDAAFTYASSVGDPPYTSDNGTNVGQVVTWELRNVNHSGTVNLTLRATTDSAPCSPDLDNEVRVWWGCGVADGSSATKPGVDPPDDSLCLTSDAVSVTRTETRKPDLGFLSISTSPANIQACNGGTQLTIAVENSGPTDAYSVDLAITLPPGITYAAGTSEAGLGTDTALVTAAIGDPAISGSTITFYDFGDKGSNLAAVIQADGGNDTLVLRFAVYSACYTSDDLAFDLRFYDCCDDTQHSETTTQQLTALSPDLSIVKIPTSAQVACGGQQSWGITVTNNGAGNAEVVRIEDVPGDWIDVRTGQSGDPIDMGGGVYGWEVNNVSAGGGSAAFTLVGTLNPDGLPNQNDCSAALRQNDVQAIWGCGTSGDATDNDPTTTAYDCTHDTWANAPAATLQMPDLVITHITPTISGAADGSFGGSIVVSVENQGDGDSDEFTVEVTDGKGWTGTSTHYSSIAPGNSVDVSIDTGSWSPGCHACGDPYSFNATVDLNNDVCECNETNNNFGPTSYTVSIPDMAVQTDTLTVTSSIDGQATVSGDLTLANSGCVTITADIPVSFTLYADNGCGGDIMEQWTETLSPTNIALDGGTQVFTITQHSFSANLCNGSSSCQVSVQTTVDFDDDIAECDGTDNVYCANKSINLPDLVISKTANLTSAIPGDAITYTLTFSNAGSATAIGVVITDRVPISVTNLNYNSNRAVTATGSFSYTWLLENLSPSEGGVITITGILSQALAPGVFSNTATIATTLGESDTANNTAEIGLAIQNIAPLADDDAFDVSEDSSSNALDVLDGDSDANGDALVVFAVGAPDNGGFVSDNDANVLYTPAADFFGVEVFTYTVSDGNGGYDTASVTVTVAPLNDPPVANDDAYTTTYETTLVVDAANGVLGNDSDVEHDPLTATLDSGPNNGALALSFEGSFVYTPTAGFSGLDSFSYVASDGALTDTATVVIGVGVAPTFTLTVAVDGNGNGLVEPDVGPHVYELNAVVTLTATANLDSEFVGWSGALAGTTSPITLTMNTDKAVTATFDLQTHILTVNAAGDGGGTVSSTPSGIDCGVDCTQDYVHGTVVTLTAAADTGSTFENWSGDVISTANPITVTMTRDTTITATFVQSGFDVYLPLVLRNY